MRSSRAALPWLPPPPSDFPQRCRALVDLESGWGETIQFLAAQALDASQSSKLAKAIGRARAAGRDLAPLSDFRLGILASATFDLILDCVPAAAARHGVACEIVTADYDQVMQEALDPASAMNGARADAVLIAVDHRWLSLQHVDLAAPEARVSAAIDQLQAVVQGLRENGGAAAILQTVAMPPESLFGSLDRRVAGSVRAMIDAANAAIVALAAETGSYLLDVAAMAESVGTDAWFDPVQWASYKLPFSAEFFPLYADHLGRLLGAIRGKARKCLVLDLDNTLWGGVIGDDGMEGIVVGQGSAMGEAFLSVQQAALDLRGRGVFLAVCSKNDDDIARGPFRGHADMLIRERHISVFQANWIDKASNLESIARALNIGLDALVLLDDNPAERAQIRAALPMVAVPELPADPAWFAWTLNAAGYFEAVSYSAEDRMRADAQGADAKRADVMAKSRDLGDYLTSLEMTITFAPFDKVGRQRIAQLINKTNQFNLTTRRYTEAEVAAMEADENVFALQVRLADRYGDLGMIGIIIARHAGDATWDIDTWLMSCRVLGRRVEEGMLARLIAEARRCGIKRLIGTYLPTAKNGMVRDHYAKLGFEIAEEADGVRRFAFELDGYTPPDLPFTSESSPFRN